MTDTYLDKDTFAQLLGITLVENAEDYAKCQVIITDQHKNGLGTVHGALIFSLADIAFAVACNTQQTGIGLQSDIRYLNRANGNRLTAEAKLIDKSNKIGHYQVTVTDDENTVIAQFSGTSYRLPKKT